MRIRRLGFLLVLLLAGCSDPPQKIARDVIAGAKGVIEQAQDRYVVECSADPAKEPCGLINKAVAAQNLAVDALSLYCASVDYLAGGPCSPNKELEPKLREALENLLAIKKQVEVIAR